MNFFSKHRSFFIYIVFGFLATVLNASCYWLFYEKIGIFSSISNSIDWSNLLSTFFAWVITIVFAFFTNKIFVYNSKSWKIGTLLSEAWQFVACRGLSEVFDLAFMYITVTLCSFNSVAMKLVASLGVGLINYFGGKLVVFKHKVIS